MWIRDSCPFVIIAVITLSISADIISIRCGVYERQNILNKRLVSTGSQVTLLNSLLLQNRTKLCVCRTLKFISKQMETVEKKQTINFSISMVNAEEKYKKMRDEQGKIDGVARKRWTKSNPNRNKNMKIEVLFSAVIGNNKIKPTIPTT